ncbi:teichoic acid synthase, partial [Burkholderia multivorans]
YAAERGTYLRPDELPGPVSESIDELLDQATRLAEDDVDLSSAFPEEAARFDELVAQLTPRDDGSASARVLDVVFRGREPEGRVIRGFADGRRTLVLYLGGLITNGITSSVLNLLNRIDPEKVDVTALYY